MKWPSASRLSLGFLTGMAAIALLAPLLGLRSPVDQPDLAFLRDRPPGTRLVSWADPSGARHFCDSVTVNADGNWVSQRSEQTILLAEEPADLRVERFWLGTDGFGRDLASRIVHGARLSLTIGLAAALLALVIGGGIGLAAGMTGGWVDEVLMRITDTMLTLPRMFLAMIIVVVFGTSITTTVLVVAGTSWMTAARLTRAEVLSIRKRSFYLAAKASGAGPWQRASRHLIPAISLPLSVEAAIRVSDAILLESSLSFLGLGVPAPAASWGNLIADGATHMSLNWWTPALPGLLLVACVSALLTLGGRRVSERRETVDPHPVR
jgi:peptide/nickel transport system permease protein